MCLIVCIVQTKFYNSQPAPKVIMAFDSLRSVSETQTVGFKIRTHCLQHASGCVAGPLQPLLKQLRNSLTGHCQSIHGLPVVMPHSMIEIPHGVEVSFLSAQQLT